MTPRLVFLSVLFTALCACEENFKPETQVEDFRVLSLTIEPPELRPGQSATVKGLVVDPSRPGRKNSVVWLACDPDPLNLGSSACTTASNAFDTSALSSPTGTPELPPPGMRIIGFNDAATYDAPADTFAGLAADDPRRQLGTVANILALAVADDVSPTATREEFDALFGRIQRKEVRNLLVLSRIPVTEAAVTNSNPVATGLLVEGVKHPEGATVRVRPASETGLSLIVPDSSFESYTQLDPQGNDVGKTETLVASWYSPFGLFSEPRIALRSDKTERFTAPGGPREPLPEKTSGLLHAVLRDTRGGQSWKEFPILICDPTLPAPQPTAVEITRDPSGLVLMTVKGDDIDQIVDVVVGDHALLGARYSPSQRFFSGEVAPLPPGQYPIVVRARNCEDVPVDATYQAL